MSMDSTISSITQLSAAMTQSQVQQTAQIAMLKKSMEAQAQSVLPLINGVTQTSANNPLGGSSNPSDSVGSVVNVSA